MRSLILAAALVAATASALCAQNLQWPQSVPLPPALTVAPTAPKVAPEASADGGKPVNICSELVAFLEQKAAPSQANAAPRSSESSPPPAVDKPQHASGLVAPVPPGEPGRKPPLVTSDQARGYAAANDVRACQDAVRQMRRAGVTLPEGLIALAALSPERLEAQQR